MVLGSSGYLTCQQSPLSLVDLGTFVQDIEEMLMPDYLNVIESLEKHSTDCGCRAHYHRRRKPPWYI